MKSTRKIINTYSIEREVICLFIALLVTIKVLNVEHIISIKTNVDMVLKGVDLKAKIVVNGCLYVQQMKVN